MACQTSRQTTGLFHSPSAALGTYAFFYPAFLAGFCNSFSAVFRLYLRRHQKKGRHKMAETKSLRVRIALILHTKVCEEKEKASQTTGQYIVQLPTGCCQAKENGGITVMPDKDRRRYSRSRRSSSRKSSGAWTPGAEGDPAGVCPGPDHRGSGYG